MLVETIKLNEKFKELIPFEDGFIPTLTAYCPDNSGEIEQNRKRPTIVICPGGGYFFTSDREAEPVALHFVGLGYIAFVLRYSTNGPKYPAQLLELSAAVSFIRKNSEKYNVDENALFVSGFSAGGHLAASLGVFWNETFIRDILPIKEGDNKPNALILCYPVITSSEHGHRGSFENLLGNDAGEADFSKLSLENQVNSLVPPVFLWHTYDDACVPVENALLFATALKKFNIPLEMHIFQSGHHGLSLCDERTSNGNSMVNTQAGSWLSLCDKWMKALTLNP